MACPFLFYFHYNTAKTSFICPAFNSVYVAKVGVVLFFSVFVACPKAAAKRVSVVKFQLAPLSIFCLFGAFYAEHFWITLHIRHFFFADGAVVGHGLRANGLHPQKDIISEIVL